MRGKYLCRISDNLLPIYFCKTNKTTAGCLSNLNVLETGCSVRARGVLLRTVSQCLGNVRTFDVKKITLCVSKAELSIIHADDW